MKYRYARGIDTAYKEALLDLFMENATIRYQGGTYEFQASGRDEIVTARVSAFHKNAAGQHMVHHPVITFEDATNAKGEWTLHDVFYDLDTRLVEFIDPISLDTKFTYRVLDRD